MEQSCWIFYCISWALYIYRHSSSLLPLLFFPSFVDRHNTVRCRCLRVQLITLVPRRTYGSFFCLFYTSPDSLFFSRLLFVFVRSWWSFIFQSTYLKGCYYGNLIGEKKKNEGEGGGADRPYSIVNVHDYQSNLYMREMINITNSKISYGIFFSQNQEESTMNEIVGYGNLMPCQVLWELWAFHHIQSGT